MEDSHGPISHHYIYRFFFYFFQASAHENVNVDAAFFAVAQLVDRSRGRTQILSYYEARMGLSLSHFGLIITEYLGSASRLINYLSHGKKGRIYVYIFLNGGRALIRILKLLERKFSNSNEGFFP